MMENYKLTPLGGWPQRLSDGVFVNPENNLEYISWRSEGNEPEPAEQVVPTSVTMRQARQALVLRGYYPSVQNALAAMQGSVGELARVEWEFSQVVERHRTLTQQMIALLGLTEEQADELFTFASTL